MPIRFHLPADSVERVAFAYSPLLEAVLSLHVLVVPKHHSLQHPWVREMRRLDPALKRRIGAFSFLYRAVFPDCVLPGEAGEFLGFDEELERLRALDADTAAYELTRPLYDWGGAEPRIARLDEPEIREALLAHARFHGPETEKLVAAGLDDPLALRDGFADLLAAYWEVGFRAEWERVEPQLADAVSAAGRQLAEHGLYSFLLGLAPQLRVEPAEEAFGLDVPHEHRVDVGDGRTLVLVPSVYVWPHVRVNCDEPWPLTLVYPAPAVAGAARAELPPAELLRVLRALAEPTRLRVLRLIGERPRSTQELAPLIGISEAGLSKHLRLLAEVGLLERAARATTSSTGSCRTASEPRARRCPPSSMPARSTAGGLARGRARPRARAALRLGPGRRYGSDPRNGAWRGPDAALRRACRCESTVPSVPRRPRDRAPR